MTVVAAMNCIDYLLIGADSCAIEVGGIQTQLMKLKKLSNPWIAWGGAGNNGVSEDCSAWMTQNIKRIGTNWNMLRTNVTEQLALLNGREIQLMQTAGTPMGSISRGKMCTEILMAGYIGREPRIIDFYQDGGSQFITQQFWAVGSAGPIAKMVYFTLNENVTTGQGLPHDLDFMIKILKTTCKFAQNVGFPVTILKVTATSIETATTLSSAVQQTP